MNDKPEWLKLKDLHDSEIIEYPDGTSRPRSRGAVYGPDDTLVDQVGDGFTNVNDIMKRFDRLPSAQELQAAGLTSGGYYIDCIGAPDYETALQISNAAKNQFAMLPAGVRARFENNPEKFLKFVVDDANTEECIQMGLKTRRPKPDQPPTPPATPATPPATTPTAAG